MPLYTFGVPDAIALGFPAAFKKFDLSGAVIYRDSGLIHGCSAMAVLTSDQDDKSAWVHYGQAMEKYLLKATSRDVRASFFSQPIDLSELRGELQAMINQGYPQPLFRGFLFTCLFPMLKSYVKYLKPSRYEEDKFS
jgi:hypothetical protein